MNFSIFFCSSHLWSIKDHHLHRTVVSTWSIQSRQPIDVSEFSLFTVYVAHQCTKFSSFRFSKEQSNIEHTKLPERLGTSTDHHWRISQIQVIVNQVTLMFFVISVRQHCDTNDLQSSTDLAHTAVPPMCEWFTHESLVLVEISSRARQHCTNAQWISLNALKWNVQYTGICLRKSGRRDSLFRLLIVVFHWGFYGVMVSTLDSESSDPSSSLGRTY